MSSIVGREEYFEAALDILAESGFAGLNVGRLGKRLGVTSGSFYHHFAGWPAFVGALLEFWTQRQVRILRELDFGSGGPEADFTALMSLTRGLRHRSEAAIRAWAANDETVRTAQKRVDDARVRTVGKVVAELIPDRRRAEVVTSLGLAMLVGYQQLAAAGGFTDLGAILDEYTRLVLAG